MKTRRKYSLFVKEGKHWVRITPLATSLDGGRRLFQGILIGGAMRGLNVGLRPAEDDFEHEAEFKVNMERFFPKREA